MILEFPNLDALRLALTGGLVPAEVSAAPALAAIGERGSVWVATTVKMPAAAMKELGRLGVQTAGSLGTGDQFRCLYWPQLLPLRREAEPAQVTAQMPVLFELANSRLLPELVGEMLRLGNDRQSFRCLDQEADTPAVLLRVIGPPYYSLLQALDRGGNEAAPLAYLERAPGVWVEAGFTHPLLEWIKPPPGKILFLRPPRDWRLLDAAPFRDIYEILEFHLPNAPARWQDTEHHDRIAVPLRLALGGSEAAELWVLRDEAMNQLETFVRNNSDQLLSRLAFAVGESAGPKCVVLRVRPSRQAPPVLVLEGQPFRPYLKLPNLFVPCGQVLLPQLRRDAVRRLLAEDPDRITWLYPDPDGTFTPESLPESAFRPLTEWVEYVLDCARVPLQAWMESAQFEFERFICKDDQKPERRPKPKEEKAARKPRPETEAAEPAVKQTDYKVRKGERPPAEDLDPLEMLPALEPSELQKRQQELEAQFLQIEGTLDAPARQALWPELARIYTAQNNQSDAAVCWANALWEESAEAVGQIPLWHAANLGEFRNQPADQVLDQLLRINEPDPSAVRLLATFILHSASLEEPDPALARRLNLVQNVLHSHEQFLPVRVVWLVALALHRLSGGDVLALARTRDRLLARLFATGLTADTDLPGFLRFSGSAGSARFQAFRDWLRKLPERVRNWLSRVNPVGAIPDSGETLAYADLILAFGYARLGEKDLAQTLQRRAATKLTERDDIHTCLLAAFGHRIEQALAGTPAIGPLPSVYLEYLEQMEKEARYKVDRLRQYSDILEPHEKIDAYRNYKARADDVLDQTLPLLVDIYDIPKLEGTIVELLRRFGSKGKEGKKNRARILLAAIELTPRIGQAFALTVLPEVIDACQQLEDMMQKATLLERALLVAAHFDQGVFVKEFVVHLQQLLQSKEFQQLLKAQPVLNRHPVVDLLLGQCFRGLRKLGMRDVIEQLLNQLTHAILQGKPLTHHRGEDIKQWASLLRVLLQVAGGWFYFGMNDRAGLILEETRKLLFTGELEGSDLRMENRQLARAYVQTLGQAPADIALRGIDELFHRLTGISDNFTTHTHYSLSQLEIIEAVVTAIVTEDFAQGSQARRWLDDDEYLVRKRIHQDVQRAMGQN